MANESGIATSAAMMIQSSSRRRDEAAQTIFRLNFVCARAQTGSRSVGATTHKWRCHVWARQTGVDLTQGPKSVQRGPRCTNLARVATLLLRSTKVLPQCVLTCSPPPPCTKLISLTDRRSPSLAQHKTSLEVQAPKMPQSATRSFDGDCHSRQRRRTDIVGESDV